MNNYLNKYQRYQDDAPQDSVADQVGGDSVYPGGLQPESQMASMQSATVTASEKDVRSVLSVNRRLLQSFVPVNALTEDHLNTLMRDRSIEYYCAGQKLFEYGDTDNCSIFLIHGRVEIFEFNGPSCSVDACDPIARFPLAHAQPRKSTAVAASDCSVVRIDNTALDNMLCWDQTADCIRGDISVERDLDEDADWMETLLRSNLFYKVPPTNIRQILDCFEACYFDAGETVLRQGEVGDCCYIIKEGSVDVFQSDSCNKPAEWVASLAEGKCFGEEALVNDTTRNATIVMRENGVLMRLGKQDFYKLLRQPDIRQLSLNAAKQQVADGELQLIDVRTLDEFQRRHVPGALNMPLKILKLKARMLNPHKTYLFYCDSGKRSDSAAYLMSLEGFSSYSLRGGIAALEDEQLETLGS